jgi:oxalate decarboxylase
MTKVSRHNVLTATAAGAMATAVTTARAGSFGNPGEPPQGAINAKNRESLTDPGPQDRVLGSQFPSAQSPSPTDVGDLPQFWASFNNAPRRIQNGGWARQVTQADFAISETISGVNMRLAAGGIRELHWHLTAEWAYMTYGKCRVTVLDDKGRAYVSDVKEGDLWYFPAGFPHSLQGLGPEGCEFIICFDDGKASEFNTTLVTDWLAHTPPEILAENFGVPVGAFSKIPLHNLWIFQGKLPSALATNQKAVEESDGLPPSPFPRLDCARKANEGRRGQGCRQQHFHRLQDNCRWVVTQRPGALREMHWHPNADEWAYWIKGKGRVTAFQTGPKAVTLDFTPGDIGYVKRNNGHYVKNVGDTDMQYLEVFRSSYYADVSLSDWLTHSRRKWSLRP